ncbi:hypothetical protein INT43_007724 [Umbelopsis isabellina]|uniref:RNA recognition motif domain-containing protein n=1 Tax=Mortierella isabellina TaxID=91625 RepID=A0A8H7UEL6_MORIS|nr:hypothetical protein INT43_007724 [Umbelopsis isabellina]
MSFSLYGDLPKPKSAKNDGEKSSDGDEIAKAWAAVAPPTAPKQEVPVPVAPTPAETAKPTGWALYNQFRPVMRKPTIQAKPKMHKPIIPVGGKVVSTMPAQTYQAASPAEAMTTPQPTASVVQNSVPLKTSVEDVNGFADLPSNVKKAKRMHKNKQKDPLAAMEFDMSEDYDPVRPNDYEAYMDQKRQRREEEERKRLEQITRSSRRSRSRSDASSESSSKSRSPSPSRYNKMFAPPESLRGPESKKVLSENIQSEPLTAMLETTVASSAPINLEETAEDAWLRRARLSGKADVVSPKSPSPSPEPDEHLGRTDDGDDRDENFNLEGSGGQHNLSRGTETTARREATQIVLLRNMVGPGEVDDMLQHETADECGKYGKVERCLIFEVPESQVGANQAVRIFVKFDSAIAAQRAVDDLNGRYFGGRVVTATFYDPARFEKLDLGPTKEEMSSPTM